MQNDQKTGLKVTVVRAASGVGTASSSIAADNYRHALFFVQSDFSGGGKSVTVQIEHSDDNTTFEPFGTLETFTGASSTAQGSIIVDHSAAKRYVRATITPASSALTNCVVVQFNEQLTPDSTANVSLSVL